MCALLARTATSQHHGSPVPKGLRDTRRARRLGSWCLRPVVRLEPIRLRKRAPPGCAEAPYGVCIGRGGRVTGSHSIRSYSAITCAPISSTSAAISSDSSTTIDVVSDP